MERPLAARSAGVQLGISFIERKIKLTRRRQFNRAGQFVQSASARTTMATSGANLAPKVAPPPPLPIAVAQLSTVEAV